MPRESIKGQQNSPVQIKTQHDKDDVFALGTSIYIDENVADQSSFFSKNNDESILVTP